MSFARDAPRPETATGEAISEGDHRRVWDSKQLFSGEKEILIVHGDQTYRLRQTRLGKLILQK